MASADTLSLARADSRIPSTIRQWETDRPILSLRFSADKNDVAISGIHVPFRGTVEARDLWAVKAVRDLDADGNYTPDVDAVLAVAVPSGAPAEALLSFNLSVVYGSPENLLLTLDVAPDAATGHTLSVLLLSFDIRLPPGSADRVDGGNFPATSGNATIATGPRPALVLPWSDFPPQANGAWRTDEYVLNPASTVTLMRPGGNQVSGILTAENNATTLFLAIGATHDVAAQPGDGASVAFDTDGNGLPTDGADDVFAVNASGGSHWRYNAAVSGWRQVEPCSPGPSASTASCASGIGFTQVGRTAHQFYEFSIPLAVLGVTSPPPPGTALRFALSGPPYNGLADTTLHSTWPLLFGPPIAFFGELRLNSGATPNQPPVLNWTGEPGYENDAVEPGAGAVGDAFLWRIAYFDADNDRPALGYPQLHIYRNSVEIPDSPFQMTAANEQDAVYTDGKTFVRAVSLTYCGGTYAYILTARDARGLPVPETVTPLREGPVVRCPNESPMFSQEGVTPFVGETGTAFAYRVAYQDPEGQPPLFIDVVVQQSDVNLTSVPLRRIGWLGAPDNYTQGAWYEENVTLTDPGTDYTFQFRASDGTATFLSSRFLGPYVTLPPPDKMSVLGLGNLAPPVVNEGARPIPFLRLTLSTSDADIDVISLLVDRVGTASVDEVLAVNDTDGSSSWTPQDVLLDVRSGAPPQITLSVPVHVVPGNPVYVLILANLTAPGNADATVGFEIRDPSYFTVAAGDAVLPFAPIRSSRASVNVAPKTAGLTVDGRADGTPGINHIVPDRPSLAWRFQDENIADVAPAGHNVSVWTSSPDTLLWYVNESNSASAVTYVGPALIDGASYVLRIRSTDGRLWSAVTEARFQMNRPPAAPALLSPLNTALGLPAQLDLHWSAVTDPDGDAIMYHWWVSEAPGFVPSMEGDGAGTSAAVVLAQGREYYWKVGASDGYEFVGNATVWSFQTAPAVVPTLGEVRGRVMNGSVPLSGALIELLVGDSVVAAAITTANGTFRLPNLALRPYTVRVSAFGFQPRTIAAEPTQGSPVVDLLDIPLSPVGGPPGGTPPPVIPMWQLALFGGLLISALVIAFLSLAIVLRRRREDVAAVAARGRSGKSVTRTTVEAAAYACPVCGREVEAGATRCECGAVFER